MQHLRVKPGLSLHGSLHIPGDKSITHRALIFSALGKGRSEIHAPLDSGDTQSTAGILRQLGVTIDQTNQETWVVQSEGLYGFSEPRGILDCGNSGTTTRLMMGVLAAQPFESQLVGDASLSKRPMDRVIQPLRRMGARFKNEAARLPLTILPCSRDGLRGIHFESPIASAQVKSSILLAGLFAQGLTTVVEPSMSRDHTERLLASFVPLQYGLMTFETPTLQGETRIQKKYRVQLKGPVSHLPNSTYFVPGDFSSAAFFLVAGFIAGESDIVVRNVGINPTRTGLVDILRSMGANLVIDNAREEHGEPVGDFHVTPGPLKAVQVQGETTLRAIDEIPIWAVAAGLAPGVSLLSDATELRSKETDRLAAMAENLKRLGVGVESTADGLVIKGREDGQFLHPKDSGYGPGYLESFDDHRIAMAMVVACLKVRGSTPVDIHHTQCIGISYPGFLSDFATLINDKTGIETC